MADAAAAAAAAQAFQDACEAQSPGTPVFTHYTPARWRYSPPPPASRGG